ncbi:MAG: hypothetical protein JW704_11210 [Anaerolineaceae bacterium]|nr:hypothetical protein [Anaerolineaceae bacterium]
MDRHEADGKPSEQLIRNQGAIPWLSQIVNDTGVKRTKALIAGLDLQTLNDEVSAAIDGDVIEDWVPTKAVVSVTGITGAANGDAEITIGTVSGGTQILGATAVGVSAADERVVIDLSGKVMDKIAGNATLFVKCTTADTGAGTALAVNVAIYGEVL